MPLNIVVTVKQVPDTHNVSGDAMKPDGTVNRAALPTVFNPEDLNALEEAIKLKERVGGKIIAITMGPPKAEEVLRDCLYRGADEVILLTDRKFAGADTLATSYALKCAIEKLGNVDIVICGRQAIDGDTAQVGPQIAEKLGMNQLSSVTSINEIDSSKIVVERETEYGQEILRSKLPVLLTINDSANEPRTGAAKLVMAHKKSTVTSGIIKKWDVKMIGAEVEQCGLSGSPTKVKKIESVVLETTDYKKIEATEQGINELVHELIQEHIIG